MALASVLFDPPSCKHPEIGASPSDTTHNPPPTAMLAAIELR